MVTIKPDHYEIFGERYPRVTRILGCIAKPALTTWAARSVAEFVVNNPDSWKSMKPEQAIRFLTGVPWTQMRGAGDRGSAIHKIFQNVLAGGGMPYPDDGPYAAEAKALAAFVERYQPYNIRSERIVLHNSEHYAGTCDLACTIRGVDGIEDDWVIDLKTGSGVYPEHALQLAAYANATHFINDEGKIEPWDLIDARLGVLHLNGSDYKLHEIVIDDPWPAFRGCIDLYHATKRDRTPSDSEYHRGFKDGRVDMWDPSGATRGGGTH